MKMLEIWLKDWMFARINHLTAIRKFAEDVQKMSYSDLYPYHLRSQKGEYSWIKDCELIVDERLKEMKDYNPYSEVRVSEKYEIDLENNDIVCYINYQGIEFTQSKIYQPRKGLRFEWIKQALATFNFSPSDFETFQIERSDEWIFNNAEKEMLIRKKIIEEKVKKICGEELTHGANVSDGFVVKGSNERKAHVFRILAGGYNIQCLHQRILVKEIK
jgi:hypothetical protein